MLIILWKEHEHWNLTELDLNPTSAFVSCVAMGESSSCSNPNFLFCELSPLFLLLILRVIVRFMGSVEDVLSESE